MSSWEDVAQRALDFLDQTFGNEQGAPWRNREAAAHFAAIRSSMAAHAPESCAQTGRESLTPSVPTAVADVPARAISDSSMPTLQPLQCQVCRDLQSAGQPLVRCGLCSLRALTNEAPDFSADPISSTISGPESTMDESRNKKLSDVILRKMEPYVKARISQAIGSMTAGELLDQRDVQSALGPRADELVTNALGDVRSTILSALAQAAPD